HLTFVIPVQPVMAGSSTPLGQGTGAGVAFNGVRFDEPAPVGAILGAHTLAPFDDCGGHVNLHVGYHYHTVTDCLNEAAAVTDDHCARIGIAMDGYMIFSHGMADGTEPAGLDRCHGHESDELGYHYHAGAPGSNTILGCLSAEHGCVSNDPNRPCDATVRPSRP
ncbi:MAG: YHYH protein, partial [Geminicoccaceae bacterium]